MSVTIAAAVYVTLSVSVATAVAFSTNVPVCVVLSTSGDRVVVCASVVADVSPLLVRSLVKAAVAVRSLTVRGLAGNVATLSPEYVLSSASSETSSGMSVVAMLAVTVAQLVAAGSLPASVAKLETLETLGVDTIVLLPSASVDEARSCADKVLPGAAPTVLTPTVVLLGGTQMLPMQASGEQHWNCRLPRHVPQNMPTCCPSHTDVVPFADGVTVVAGGGESCVVCSDKVGAERVASVVAALVSATSAVGDVASDASVLLDNGVALLTDTNGEVECSVSTAVELTVSGPVVFTLSATVTSTVLDTVTSTVCGTVVSSISPSNVDTSVVASTVRCTSVVVWCTVRVELRSRQALLTQVKSLQQLRSSPPRHLPQNEPTADTQIVGGAVD